MSERTLKLKLPFIVADQAQKHVTHNEALLALDAVAQASVLDRDLTAPPASPAEGDSYIVAASATGDWAGKDDEIAVWQDGVWRFHAPNAGWIVHVADEGRLVVWSGSLWRDFGEMMGQLANLDMLGVNTSADTTNRLSAKSDAVLFSHDDVTPGSGDMHVKVNKKTTTNTAAVLFQNNWSARAEFGLAGDDDFRIKVSPDGSGWHEGMLVAPDSGQASFPNGFDLERHHAASVDISGGSDWWGPADHMTLAYSNGSGLSLTANRMYFASLYVPRPLRLLGCFVSLYTASTEAGALLRVGLYKLGAPNGNSWDIGERVSDFGAQAADSAGNKVFDLSSAQMLDRGWYVTAFGVSGAGAKAIYGRWLTPGMQRVYPYSSGASARPLLSGPSVYLYEDNCASEITGGLPATWEKNPVSDAISANAWVYQCVFPKWREI